MKRAARTFQPISGLIISIGFRPAHTIAESGKHEPGHVCGSLGCELWLRPWQQYVPLAVITASSLSALHIWIWGFSPIPYRFYQALSSWIWSVGEQQSSSRSIDSPWDLSLSFGWATQGLCGSCSEAIPVLLWLYAWGHCPVGM